MTLISVATRAGLVLLVTAAVTAGSAGSSPSPGKIFFWSDRGRPSLYAMRPTGTAVHAVLVTQQNAKRPVLSPDGRSIVFDGAAPGKRPMSDFDLQVVRVGGGKPRTLAGSAAFELDGQWSPDGRRLSFSRLPEGDWRRSSIWLVGRDGTGARRVARGQFARWSPDGTQLVLDAPTARSDGDLAIVGLDGRVHARLTSTRALEQPAAWSPDGSRILFTRFTDGALGADVLVIGADGTGERRLTRSRGDDVAADWSPDGRMILFTSTRTGHEQVFVMNADGSGQRNLSRNRFGDVATSWR